MPRFSSLYLIPAAVLASLAVPANAPAPSAATTAFRMVNSQWPVQCKSAPIVTKSGTFHRLSCITDVPDPFARPSIKT